MPELPIASVFEIPDLGLVFHDRQTVSLEVQNAAALLWGKHLIVDWRAPMGDNAPPGLCDDNVERANLIQSRFDTFAETVADDWEAFELAGGTVTREIDRDPRLGALSLVAMSADTGATIGTYGLHNLRTENGRSSAYLIPGLGPIGELSRELVWSRVALYLLKNELELEGGQVLDLAAILLPDETPDVSFSRNDSRGIGAYFDALEAGGCVFTYSETRPGVVVRVELGA